MLTIDHGPGRTRDERGRFQRLFVLTYEKLHTDGETVSVRRTLSARGVETVGAVIDRLGDRGEVWNIRVVDSACVDVTLDFVCFRGE